LPAQIVYERIEQRRQTGLGVHERRLSRKRDRFRVSDGRQRGIIGRIRVVERPPSTDEWYNNIIIRRYRSKETDGTRVLRNE